MQKNIRAISPAELDLGQHFFEILRKEECTMTALEKTVSMLENFSDVDLEKVQNMITVVFMEKHTVNPFRVLSAQEILEQLDYSRSQAVNGQVADVDMVCETIANKYGL